MRERIPFAPTPEQESSSPNDPHLEAFQEAIRLAYHGGEPIPEALIHKAGAKFSKEAQKAWEQTMGEVSERINKEYAFWRRKMIRTTQAAGIALVGLTGADYLAHAEDARDATAEHAADTRHQAATRAALTRALAELPAGPIRALAQADIERAYGALADGNWSVPSDIPQIQDQDAEQAILRFQHILHAIQEGSAEQLAQAVEAYTQSTAHLSETRRTQVEHAVMQWHAKSL